MSLNVPASDQPPQAHVEPEGSTDRRRAKRRPSVRSSSRLWLYASRAAMIGIFLALWDAAVRLGRVDVVFVSTPGDVAGFLVEAVRSSEFWLNVQVTLGETLTGFAFGAVAGVIFGLILARLPWFDAVVDPFLTFLNSLPRVALAPLFVLWFGIGETSKVMLAVSLVFFILAANTRAGVKSVDPELVIAARLLGARPQQVIVKVVLPSAVPPIFAGLRLGIVYALLGVIAGEIIAAERGVGQQLAFYAGVFNTAGVIGLLFVLGLIGAGLNGIMATIERHLLTWQSKGVYS